MDMQLTPNQLHANLEVLHTGTENEYGSGYTDALAHVGGLVSGVYAPEVIAEVHSEMLDRDRSGYSASYTEGYIAQWNRLVLLTNAALVKADGYGADEYLP